MKDSQGQIRHESEIYRVLAEMTAEGRAGVLATVITTRLSTPRQAGSKMIIHGDGGITGSIGGGKAEAVVMDEARKVLDDGVCRRLDLDLAGGLGVCGGHMEVFLEPVCRTSGFLVIGAGHVGRALVEMGSALPFRFTLIDDREEFLAPLKTLPGVTLFAAGPEDLSAGIQVTATTAVLVASRSHDLDERYLESLLEAEAAAGCRFGFLGVLGSRSKAAKLKAGLKKSHPGWQERVDDLHLPVGLEIGGETPHEIALSVLAEVLAVLRKAPVIRDDGQRAIGLTLRRHREKGASDE